MAAEPDRIRAEIESTREELADDLDRLADRTSPKRIVRRRWDAVKDKANEVRETVMGASQQAGAGVSDGAGQVGERLSAAGSAVSDKAGDMMDTVKQTPGMVTRKTRGNPLAVGIIAFGAGLLAASLLPETDAERRLGRQAGEHVDGLVEPVKESVQAVLADVKDTAGDAAQQVGHTAREAVGHTAQQAKESGQVAVKETTGSRP